MRHVVVLGFLAGCAAPADDVLDRTFDVCAPIAIDVIGADPAQRASVDDAIALWRARGATGLGAGGAGAPRIEIRFEPAAPAHYGYYADETGVVYVNARLEDPDARAVTIAHELGHAFGMWHVERDDRPSVMNPGNLAIAPNQADAEALLDLWGACPPATTHGH